MEKTSLRHITTLLSFSLFVIYFWFGIQKFFPHVSPAEEIASKTIQALTFNLFSPKLGLLILAFWEVGISILVLCCPNNKYVLAAIFVHLIFTFSPFLLFPALTQGDVIGSLSLLGQYIVKNLILLVSVYTLYALGKEKNTIRSMANKVEMLKEK